MRFDRESWRRLYRHEPLEQRAWPLVTRAVRDHLIRYPDELDGYLMTVAARGDNGGDNQGDIMGDIVDALCNALGTHPDERPLVERALKTLLGDRYLVVDDAGRVSIRNYEEAQKSKEARKKANQRAKKRGDIQGTPGGQPQGHGAGHSGDNQGDSRAGARTRGDETRRDEKKEPLPLSGQAGTSTGPPDPLSYLDGKAPAQRADVQRVHAAWKRSCNFPNHKFRGPYDLDAKRIAEAVDAYGEADCLLVADHASTDGMVNGKADENRRKHDSIRYIFENADTFNRILRSAQGQEYSSRKRRPARDAIAEAKAL